MNFCVSFPETFFVNEEVLFPWGGWNRQGMFVHSPFSLSTFEVLRYRQMGISTNSVQQSIEFICDGNVDWALGNNSLFLPYFFLYFRKLRRHRRIHFVLLVKKSLSFLFNQKLIYKRYIYFLIKMVLINNCRFSLQYIYMKPASKMSNL